MVDRPLLDPTLLWDALEDLPNLDNWSMVESAEYGYVFSPRLYQISLLFSGCQLRDRINFTSEETRIRIQNLGAKPSEL